MGPTNHLDIWALDALASALGKFTGAIVLVSHNRHFVRSFCKELWICEKGAMKTMRSEDSGDAFSALFSTYISGISKKYSVCTSAARGGKYKGKQIDAKKLRSTTKKSKRAS